MAPHFRRHRSRPRRHRILWGACAVLALGAGAVCAWLWYQKLTGRITSLAGCGGEGGCSQLLGGRWSAWFGIPVSFPAMLNYAALGAAAMAMGIGVRSRVWPPIAAGAMLLGVGGAAWFLGLQAFVEREWCPFCSTIHGLGLGAAALGLTALRSRRKEEDDTARDIPWKWLVGGALAALGVLAAGQMLGPAPQSHQVVETSGPLAPGPAGDTAPDASPSADAANGDPTAPRTDDDGLRVVSFYRESLRLKPATLPMTGSPDAPVIMAKVFDYTCGSCRIMHDHLAQAERAHPGRFAVIMLPAPINRACNEHVPAGIADHADACELARIALATWVADRSKFEKMNEYLFSQGALASPTRSREEAEKLVGADAFAAALDSPAVAGLLDQSTRLFGALTRSNPRMPKLLIRDGVTFEGVARDGSEFVRTLEQHLGSALTGE